MRKSVHSICTQVPYVILLTLSGNLLMNCQSAYGAPASVNSESLAQLESAVKKNPKDAQRWMALADFNMNHKNITTAVGNYNEVLKLSPNNVKALETCGKLNMVQQFWRQAAEHFTALSKLSPRAEVFADCGDAKFLSHDQVGAAHDWFECHKRALDNPAYTERAGFGNYFISKWLEGAKCFDAAWQSKSKPPAWALADACLAYIGYGIAGDKANQSNVLKAVSMQHPSDMDLFDTYTLDYLASKLPVDEYLKKKSNDPYYRAQANLFVGANLMSSGKAKEGRLYLSKCDMETWAAKDDFKLPFEAVAKAMLKRKD